MTRNQILKYDGISQTVDEWALDYGIPAETILRRLREGMPVQKAITKPIKAGTGATLPEAHTYRPATISFGRRNLSYSAWAAETGLPETTLRSRIRDGWSVEETSHDAKAYLNGLSRAHDDAVWWERKWGC